MNEQQFDAIVSGFYKAATGASGWEVALEPLQRAFGARAAVLHPWSMQDGRMLGLHAAGGPHLESALLDYVRTYHLVDPRKEVAMRLGPQAMGRWLHCHEHLEEDFMAANDFCQNYLVAYDTRYNSNIALPINEQVLMGVVLELPQARGPLNPDEREFARRLGAHLHDALLAYERVRQLMQQALAGHQLLNNYPYPMWLLDAQRAITFENPAAVAERERDRRVAAVGQRLVLVNSTADRRLGECLLHLHQAGHGAQASVDLRPTEADPPLWLHLSLLVPGATLGAFGERPMVLATLFDPQHVSALDPFALAQMFRLTPTEAKVAVRVAEGLTAEQIGAQLHTAESTVRSHIRAVLAKLGASRTADVVRLLRQGEALWAAPRPGAG